MDIGYQEINATRRVSYLISHANTDNWGGCLIPTFLMILLIATVISAFKEMINAQY